MYWFVWKAHKKKARESTRVRNCIRVSQMGGGKVMYRSCICCFPPGAMAGCWTAGAVVWTPRLFRHVMWESFSTTMPVARKSLKLQISSGCMLSGGTSGFCVLFPWSMCPFLCQYHAVLIPTIMLWNQVLWCLYLYLFELITSVILGSLWFHMNFRVFFQHFFNV